MNVADLHGPLPPPPPPLDHSAGRVTLLNGDIFYSPNSQRPAVLPDPPVINSYLFRGTSLRLQTFYTPRWWTQPYGWLAFLPLRPSFSGYPFDRLNIFPVIEQVSSSEHRLHPDLMQLWKRLENKLIWATTFLGQHYPAACIRPPPPSSSGYVHSYSTARAARAQAHASRDWFVMWMGLLSYRISNVSPSAERPPAWVDLLVGLGFPQAWMMGILGSTVADFSPHVLRVGVFLDPLEPPPQFGTAPRSVDFFCEHHVPVWYPWTSRQVQAARENSSLAQLAPPPELLQDAASFLIRSPSPSLSSVPTFSASSTMPIHTSSSPRQVTSPAASAPIIPSSLSQQFATATSVNASSWELFFKRRAERHVNVLRNETPAQRDRRMQRQRHPPTVKTSVYQWIQTEDDPFNRTREKVARRWNAAILDDYIGRRRYDAIENEWDVCSEFTGDDAEDDDAEEDEEYPDMLQEYLYGEPAAVSGGVAGGHPQPTEVHGDAANIYASANPFNRAPSPVAAVEVDEDAADIYASANPFNRTPSPVSAVEVSADYQMSPPNPVEYLAFHYGYTPPLSVLLEDPDDQRQWKIAQRAVGLVMPADMSISPVEIGMARFVRSLIMGKSTSDNCDLYDENRNALLHSRSELRFSYVALTDSPTNSGTNPRSTYSKIIVLSSPPSSACTWHLGLFSAKSAVYAFRLIAQSSQDIFGVSRHLIEQGIPFRTLQLLRAPVSMSRSNYIKSTPFRLSGYVFTLHDYAAYLRDRAAILSQPWARAALLRGGIVWRLAIDNLSVDAALDGPSSAVDVHHIGDSFHDERFINKYCDDGITDHDLSMICGSYECFTGSHFILLSFEIAILTCSSY